MFSIMPDRLASGLAAGSRAGILGGVPISIPAGETAAGYLRRETMARLEHMGDRPKINLQFVNPAGLQPCSLFQGMAIARADDAIAKILHIAVGVHVH